MVRQLLQMLRSDEHDSQWLVEQSSTVRVARLGPFDGGMFEVEKHSPRLVSMYLLATDCLQLVQMVKSEAQVSQFTSLQSTTSLEVTFGPMDAGMFDVEMQVPVMASRYLWETLEMHEVQTW